MNTESEFVGYIVAGITGAPDCFDITELIDDSGTIINLSVDKEHLGRVIGRQGHTAESIRNLLRALGMRDSARYRLKIEERS